MFKLLFKTPFFPEVLSDFFDSGMSEEKSPLLSASGKNISKNLRLKASIFSTFLYLIALSSHLLGWPSVEFLCTWLVFFFSGTPAVIQSLEDLYKREINVDILMTFAAFGSIFIGGSLEGALLLVLFDISESLGDSVTEKAKSTISSLKQLAPLSAWVKDADGSLSKKSIKNIAVGDVIHVKSGEVVPLDGKILHGKSSVNLMYLTGEKVPRDCQEGDFIPSGARNLEGAFDLSVLKTGSDSTLARIVKLVVQAQNNKPKLQQRLDRYSSAYAITIFSCFFLIALITPLISSLPFLGLNSSFYRALSFLIAASPCALIIAIPIAYLSAINSCAKQGILLKGGGVILDQLALCDTIALDKTGTLTTGDLTCLRWTFFGKADLSSQFLSLIRGVEQSSNHPIATAIASFIEKKGISPTLIHNYITEPGVGVKGEVDGKKIFVGKVSVGLEMLSKEISELVIKEVSLSKAKGEICSLAIYDQLVAIFHCKDNLRPDSQQAIQEISSLGFSVLMLTGDHEVSAQTTAQTLGIQEFFSNLTPEGKLCKLDELATTKKLIMVGDGVNDAPALAKASVGVAMGEAGNASAIDAADIVLLNNSLTALPFLMKKAKKTRRIVSQNISLALSIICLISIPAAMGFIPLWLAVILHEGSTVVVGLNALRLLKN